MWVVPFGNRGIKACSQLPHAYRSVPRPSSPVHAKAFTKCPYLTLESPHHQRQRWAMLTKSARHSASRSEEHTSELQSLMRISYAVFCLKKQTRILLNTTPKTD